MPQLQKTEVIVVSNSLAYKIDAKMDENNKPIIKVGNVSGGLGIGLQEAFSGEEFQRGTWYATKEKRLIDKGENVWNQEVENAFTESVKSKDASLVFNSPEDHYQWYENATSGFHWPLLHELMQYASENPSEGFPIYEQVNKKMADAIIEGIKDKHEGEIPKDVIVWVQDYHFYPLINNLKQAEPNLPVGFYLHVPFPEITPEYLKEHNIDVGELKETLASVIEADSIGFHIETYKQNFINTLLNLDIITKEQVEGVSKKIKVNPIGVSKSKIQKDFDRHVDSEVEKSFKVEEVEDGFLKVDSDFGLRSFLPEFLESKNEHVKDLPVDAFSDTKIHFGSVSRTDFTKGLKELLEGYEKFLDLQVEKGIKNPGEKYQLNLVSSPARSISKQLEYQAEVLDAIKELQEKYPGSLQYFRGLNNDTLPAFNSSMDVLLCTSVADGYNMSIGEAMMAKKNAIEKGLVDLKKSPTFVIIGEKAGIAKDIIDDDLTTVKSIEITPENIVTALTEITQKTEEIKNSDDFSAAIKNAQDLKKTTEKIGDIKSFASVSLSHIKYKDAKKFDDTLVTNVLLTDSDGTVITYSGRKEGEIPPDEFVKEMREYSFEHPNTLIGILSGRPDDYLEEHYGPSFKEDSNGRKPKIILLGENGATLRSSLKPKDKIQIVEPFSEDFKSKIADITKKHAGEYFRKSDQELVSGAINIWIDPKSTAFGIFYKTPTNESQREILKDILGKIKDDLVELQKEFKDFKVHLDSVDSFTMEKISKGETVKKILKGEMKAQLTEAGIKIDDKIEKMVYSGDDVSDIPAQNAVNEALISGELEKGYSTRINDYRQRINDQRDELMQRTAPKSPEDGRAMDSFYVVGDDRTTGQDQHRQYFLNDKKMENIENLRKEMTKRKLMPSQVAEKINEKLALEGKPNMESKTVPPIVLLTSGDILIQDIEPYKQADLIERFRHWPESLGKLVVVGNKSLKGIASEISPNLVVVDSENNCAYHMNKTSPLLKQDVDEIISNDKGISDKISDLRRIQKGLQKYKLITTPPITERFLAPLNQRKKAASGAKGQNVAGQSQNPKKPKFAIAR